MKLYKVIKNGKAKDGGDFDYTPYLPVDGKESEWTPLIKNIKLCKCGYHVTPYYNMYDCEGSEIYEVETKDLLQDDTVGVVDKYVCGSIRLVKRVFPKYDLYNNTGDYNTGGYNTGDCNTGDCNTGDRNTGDRNTGVRNTGDCNTGSRNTGDRNTGVRNTGDCNTGSRNTGGSNTGGHNTGHWNTGDYNTGHWNTGDYNTGHWNTGSYHSGWFNTPKHEAPRLLFGKPFKGNIIFPHWFYTVEIGKKDAWLRAFSDATRDEIRATITLPNFDYNVFEEITGITKQMIEEKIL